VRDAAEHSSETTPPAQETPRKPRSKGHRIKPGQVLNPRGRPKGSKNISELKLLLKKIGRENIALTLRGTRQKRMVSKKEAMLLVAYEQAIEGNAAARDFIVDRTEGKVKEQFDIVSQTIVVDIEGEDDPDESDD